MKRSRRRLPWSLRLGWLMALGALQAGPVAWNPKLEEPGPFLLWESQLTLRAAGGYKENVLLAADRSQDSALAILGVEWLVLRPPLDENSFSFFFSADERRYLNPAETAPGLPPAREEQVFLSHLEYSRALGRHFSAGLHLTHVYNEQVLDASEFGGDPGSVRVAGHGLIATPSARWTWDNHVFVELGLPVTREILREPISSYWEWGPKAVVGWQYGRLRSIEASVSYLQRPFDTRELADPLGIPIPDTHLTTRDVRSELVWKHAWDADRHIRTTARFFHVRRTDNGEGFTDYDRVGVSGTVSLDYRRWLLRGTVRWSTYDFPLQIVSVFEPVPRTRVELEMEARAEYKWSAKWRSFAEIVYEQQRSNVPSDDFHSHVWQVGIEHDF